MQALDRTNWAHVLSGALAGCREARIISPFVSDAAVAFLLRHFGGHSLRLITRYCLEDFFAGVSQLNALSRLLSAGARVRGIRGLHSKVYIFDPASTIITSANLTAGGLFGNHEFGVHVDAPTIVSQSLTYFDQLWDVGGADLHEPQVAEWRQKVDAARAKHGRSGKTKLPDHGKRPPDETTPPPQLATAGPTNTEYLRGDYQGTRYHVKFFATGNARAPVTWTCRQAIESAECHYACTYPRDRRPRQVKHGDIVYMAYLTRDPWGHAIFGRAVGIPYQKGRDDATPNEIARKGWKDKWPHYIRVFDPVFIDATLGDCVWLHDIMAAHGHNSFLPTARNAARGRGNTNPRKSLMQQPAMALTLDAARDLEQRFDQALQRHGVVPESFIDSLPKPDIQL